MKIIKTVILVSALVAGMTTLTFASWWNPFTWFTKSSNQVKQEKVIDNTTKATSTKTSSKSAEGINRENLKTNKSESITNTSPVKVLPTIKPFTQAEADDLLRLIVESDIKHLDIGVRELLASEREAFEGSLKTLKMKKEGLQLMKRSRELLYKKTALADAMYLAGIQRLEAYEKEVNDQLNVINTLEASINAKIESYQNILNKGALSTNRQELTDYLKILSARDTEYTDELSRNVSQINDNYGIVTKKYLYDEFYDQVYYFLNGSKFFGYRCTEECSGHEAGYIWAMANHINFISDCDGQSQSFIEGCMAYVKNK